MLWPRADAKLCSSVSAEKKMIDESKCIIAMSKLRARCISTVQEGER
jgi:hypothetical protein